MTNLLTKHNTPIPHATIDLGDQGTLYVTEQPRGRRMLSFQAPNIIGPIPGAITQLHLSEEARDALIDALRQPGEREG